MRNTHTICLHKLICVSWYSAGILNLNDVLLKSPNVDAFAVSMVFLVGKSWPTFVVDQQQTSCYRKGNPVLADSVQE
jgi:hypothetical protein